MSLKGIMYMVLLGIFLYFMVLFVKFIYFYEIKELTKEPINIDKHFIFELDKPIHNFEQSSIEIHLLETILFYTEDKKKPLYEYKKEAKRIFKSKMFKVCFSHNKDLKRKFCTDRSKNFGFNGAEISIDFTISNISKYTPFNRVEIITEVPLKNIRIFWGNWEM